MKTDIGNILIVPKFQLLDKNAKGTNESLVTYKDYGDKLLYFVDYKYNCVNIITQVQL